MAERKSGPVKPPTIDLTARDTEKPAPRAADRDKPSATKDETARSRRESSLPSGAARATGSDKTRPEAKPADDRPAAAGDWLKKLKMPDLSGLRRLPRRPDWLKLPGPLSPALTAGIVGALAGGVLGLAAAYGLAAFGLWPDRGDRGEIASLSDEMASLYVKKSEIGSVVDRAVVEVTSQVSDLGTRIATLENRTVSDPTSELNALSDRATALEAGLSGLDKKIDTVAASGGDAATGQALPGLNTRLDDISTRVENLSASLTALEDKRTVAPEAVTALGISLRSLEERIATLAGRLNSLQSAPAPAPVDIRLPLALSGLADALESGAPFADELTLIRTALPDLAIPETVATAAASGLGSPADLAAQFAALLPHMLAAKPAAADAGWTDRVLDYFKALVALRPVAATGDTSPEALVGAIESALAVRDYKTASAAFAALPEPMRAAANGLDDRIAQFAAVTDFAVRARDTALMLAGKSS